VANLPLPEKPSNATEIGAMVGAAIRPHTRESHAPQNGEDSDTLTVPAAGSKAKDCKDIALSNSWSLVTLGAAERKKGGSMSRPVHTCK